MLPMQSLLAFSSIASLTGPAGSSNYATANASLDALACHQTSQGWLQLARITPQPFLQQRGGAPHMKPLIAYLQSLGLAGTVGYKISSTSASEEAEKH